MASVNIYLNFTNQTEEAFNFYKSVFSSEFVAFQRFGDMPPSADQPPMPDHVNNSIMHVSLPILGGHLLMGSDAPAEFGFTINQGNSFYINLNTDTRAETKKYFDLLSEGGKIEQPLEEMFWGAYYGSCRDKFGVNWMFNCDSKI